MSVYIYNIIFIQDTYIPANIYPPSHVYVSFIFFSFFSYLLVYTFNESKLVHLYEYMWLYGFLSRSNFWFQRVIFNPNFKVYTFNGFEFVYWNVYRCVYVFMYMFFVYVYEMCIGVYMFSWAGRIFDLKGWFLTRISSPDLNILSQSIFLCLDFYIFLCVPLWIFFFVHIHHTDSEAPPILPLDPWYSSGGLYVFARKLSSSLFACCSLRCYP